eukprot:361515-Chlamydomonas_euryale.AAC.5
MAATSGQWWGDLTPWLALVAETDSAGRRPAPDVTRTGRGQGWAVAILDSADGDQGWTGAPQLCQRMALMAVVLTTATPALVWQW